MATGISRRYYTLHLKLALTENLSSVGQDTSIDILTCVKEGNELKLITIYSDITVSNADIDGYYDTVNGISITYFIIGYYLGTWYVLPDALNIGITKSMLEENDETAIIGKLQANPASSGWCVPEPWLVDHTYTDQFSYNSQDTSDYSFAVTGNLLGGNVSPITNTSPWSLGDRLHKWKNIYSEKVLSDAVYTPEVLPQKNQTYESVYLVCYGNFNSPSGEQEYKEPLIFMPYFGTSNLLHFYQTTTTGVYSTTILVNDTPTTLYLDESQFTDSAGWENRPYKYNLYTDQTCETESGLFLNRIGCEISIYNRKDYYDSGRDPDGAVEYQDPENVYFKILKIGNGSGRYGYNEYYIYCHTYREPVINPDTGEEEWIDPNAGDYTVYTNATRDPDTNYVVLIDPYEITVTEGETTKTITVTADMLGLSNIILHDLKAVSATIGSNADTTNKTGWWDEAYIKSITADTIHTKTLGGSGSSSRIANIYANNISGFTEIFGTTITANNLGLPTHKVINIFATNIHATNVGTASDKITNVYAETLNADTISGPLSIKKYSFWNNSWTPETFKINSVIRDIVVADGNTWYWVGTYDNFDGVFMSVDDNGGTGANWTLNYTYYGKRTNGFADSNSAAVWHYDSTTKNLWVGNRSNNSHRIHCLIFYHESSS